MHMSLLNISPTYSCKYSSLQSLVSRSRQVSVLYLRKSFNYVTNFQSLVTLVQTSKFSFDILTKFCHDKKKTSLTMLMMEPTKCSEKKLPSAALRSLVNCKHTVCMCRSLLELYITETEVKEVPVSSVVSTLSRA